MLKIEHFSKSFGNLKAIDDLSFEVKDGDICAFIGHNGAGKTTTLKAIAGIIEFEEGNIFINNLDIKKNEMECKQNTAFVMDNPDIYDFLTGIDYLNFIANICRINKKDREERIEKLSNRLEIKDDLGKMISSYSHGMKQKLVLVSAFMRNPRLLLLDEPFVGLDPQASFSLKELMKEFVNGGGAILFSTHVLEVAQRLCNKVVIIKNGKLVTSGLIGEVVTKSLEETYMETYKHE